jgi:hypothetical protein
MRARQCCRDIQADADQKNTQGPKHRQVLGVGAIADEFEAVNDVGMHESLADEIEEGVENEKDARIVELERLLTVGQGMSAEELERALAGV